MKRGMRIADCGLWFDMLTTLSEVEERNERSGVARHGSRGAGHNENCSTIGDRCLMIRSKFEFGKRSLTSHLLSLTSRCLLNEDHHLMGRSSRLISFRKGGGALLAESPDRSSSHGRRSGGDRSNRVHHHHDSLRSSHAGPSQASGALPLSQLPEHDETMDLGKTGKGTSRLSLEVPLHKTN